MAAAFDPIADMQRKAATAATGARPPVTGDPLAGMNRRASAATAQAVENARLAANAQKASEQARVAGARGTAARVEARAMPARMDELRADRASRTAAATRSAARAPALPKPVIPAPAAGQAGPAANPAQPRPEQAVRKTPTAPAATAPAAAAPAATAPTPAATAKAGMLKRSAGWVGGKASGAAKWGAKKLGPLAAPAMAYMDDAEARERAGGVFSEADRASGIDQATALATGTLGYMGGAAGLGTNSPQDIGAAIADARDMASGGKAGRYLDVPKNERGFARRAIEAVGLAGAQTGYDAKRESMATDAADYASRREAKLAAIAQGATPEEANARGNALTTAQLRPGAGAGADAPINWIDPPKDGETSSGPRVPSALDASDDRATADASAMYAAAQRRSDAGTGPLVMAGGTSAASRDGGLYDKAPPSAVIGQFNGRDITKAEAEARGAMLPTSNGPVIGGGAGVNAVAFNQGRDRGPGNASGFRPGAPLARGGGVNANSVPGQGTRDVTNGYGGNTAQSGGMDAATYGNPDDQAASAARRSSGATPGYQAQGLRTSKGPSEEDRRRLEHDLSTLGKGSPSMRRALMDRYDNQANNAERGLNTLADSDLNAGARSQDEFAGRQQQGSQFDMEMEAKQGEAAARREDNALERQTTLDAAGITAGGKVQAEMAKARRLEQAASDKQYNTYLTQAIERGDADPTGAARRQMGDDSTASGGDYGDTKYGAAARTELRDNIGAKLLDARSGLGVRKMFSGELPNWMNEDGAADPNTIDISNLETRGAGGLGVVGNMFGGDDFSVYDGKQWTTVDPTEFGATKADIDAMRRRTRANQDKADASGR